MNTREEFVEELATVMCEEFGTEACEEYCGSNVCANRFIAEKLYDAGYRKQSDTAREILQKLIYNITVNNTNDGYLSESIDYSSTIDDIKKLAKEYGAEVEE